MDRADVVHVHAVDNYISTIAARMAKIRDLPMVLQPHGAYNAFHRDQRAAIKFAYLRLIDGGPFGLSKAIVASSDREADGVKSVLGQDATVIPLGVDPWLFELERKRSGAGQVLFLGRVTEKKSVDLVLRSFALSGLASAGVRLMIAGPVDPRLPYDPVTLAQNLSLGESVRFTGPVDRKRRSDLLSSSDVFVLPSKDESFGVAVAEAMAAGCAVIASPHVGVVPTAARALALRAVELDDERWARELARLFGERRELDELGANARAFAHGQFDWRGISHRFSDLYRRVLA